jgi:hypothetical protein
VGEQQDTTVASGSSLTLSVSVGGSANHYQWKKNGIEIVGATDSVFNIASVTFSDTGTYNCQINNTIATELILYSRPIIVTIDSTSGVQSPLAGIPPEFVLEQNYPNPFNSSTNIRYLLPTSCHVFIVVYDVLGRDVAVLVDSKQEAGIHEITWDGKDLDGLELASGVYFYKLQGEKYEEIKKLLKMQ